jgi:hypothetical protein
MSFRDVRISIEHLLFTLFFIFAVLLCQLTLLAFIIVNDLRDHRDAGRLNLMVDVFSLDL